MVSRQRAARAHLRRRRARVQHFGASWMRLCHCCKKRVSICSTATSLSVRGARNCAGAENAAFSGTLAGPTAADSRPPPLPRRSSAGCCCAQRRRRAAFWSLVRCGREICEKRARRACGREVGKMTIFGGARWQDVANVQKRMSFGIAGVRVRVPGAPLGARSVGAGSQLCADVPRLAYTRPRSHLNPSGVGVNSDCDCAPTLDLVSLHRCRCVDAAAQACRGAAACPRRPDLAAAAAWAAARRVAARRPRAVWTALGGARVQTQAKHGADACGGGADCWRVLRRVPDVAAARHCWVQSRRAGDGKAQWSGCRHWLRLRAAAAAQLPRGPWHGCCRDAHRARLLAPPASANDTPVPSHRLTRLHTALWTLLPAALGQRTAAPLAWRRVYCSRGSPGVLGNAPRASVRRNCLQLRTRAVPLTSPKLRRACWAHARTPRRDRGPTTHPQRARELPGVHTLLKTVERSARGRHRVGTTVRAPITHRPPTAASPRAAATHTAGTGPFSEPGQRQRQRAPRRAPTLRRTGARRGGQGAGSTRGKVRRAGHQHELASS